MSLTLDYRSAPRVSGGTTPVEGIPFGSSLTTDYAGDIEAFVQSEETNATPVDMAAFELALASQETNPAPGEESTFVATMSSAEANARPTEVVSITLEQLTQETSPAPAEADTQAVTASSAETNAQPADTVGLIAADIAQGADTAPAPGEVESAVLDAGATSVTVSNTAGTGWTNPANAGGLQNGTNATMNSAAGLGPARQTGALTGVYASLGTPAGVTQGTVTLTFHYTLSIAALTTGNMELAYSLNGGTNYTVLVNQTASANGPTSTSITLPIASLGSLRFRVTASVQGSALAASTATLDAVVATFNLTGV